MYHSYNKRSTQAGKYERLNLLTLTSSAISIGIRDIIDKLKMFITSYYITWDMMRYLPMGKRG